MLILNVKSVDIAETSAPVVTLISVFVFFSIVVLQQRKLLPTDAIAAFLSGNLDRTVFAEQPAGYEKYNLGFFVCYLD